eukprot:TRINITY_DN1857_c0_g1_i1.p1 TRINITY_DN1857_c0_g1~~TRINITY_DN1857_c0_g1_i1.p1  ORF type:complete len:606 (-),score=102.73 TRINITY_DN1857_c0_g1_i1:44-1861(-)
MDQQQDQENIITRIRELNAIMDKDNPDKLTLLASIQSSPETPFIPKKLWSLGDPIHRRTRGIKVTRPKTKYDMTNQETGAVVRVDKKDIGYYERQNGEYIQSQTEMHIQGEMQRLNTENVKAASLGMLGGFVSSALEEGDKYRQGEVSGGEAAANVLVGSVSSGLISGGISFVSRVTKTNQIGLALSGASTIYSLWKRRDTCTTGDCVKTIGGSILETGIYMACASNPVTLVGSVIGVPVVKHFYNLFSEKDDIFLYSVLSDVSKYHNAPELNMFPNQTFNIDLLTIDRQIGGVNAHENGQNFDGANSVVYSCTYNTVNIAVKAKNRFRDVEDQVILERHAREYNMSLLFLSQNARNIIPTYGSVLCDAEQLFNGIIDEEFFGTRSYCIAYPLYEGSMRSLIDNKINLDLTTFLSIAVQILRGCIEFKLSNAVHLDIKPDNILYKRYGEYYYIVIADLEFCMICEDLTACRKSEVLYGAPGYKPREYLNCGVNEYFDASKLDSYSAGCVLLELLQLPLPNQEDEGPYQFPYRLKLPERLERVLRGLVAHDFDNRMGCEIAWLLLNEELVSNDTNEDKQNRVNRVRAEEGYNMIDLLYTEYNVLNG